MSAVELDERGVLARCARCRQRNRMAYERLGQTFRCGQCQTELAAPAAPVEVRSEAVFKAITGRSAWPVLVDFWAAWCGPCKMVAPELVKVAAAGAGQWIVAKVNTEELPSVAQAFRIASIPTLVLFANGREIARQSGALPAATIQQFIRQHSPA